MQRTALGQLDGGLSRRLLGLRSDLIELEALIALRLSTFRKRMMDQFREPGLNKPPQKIATSLNGLLATASAGEVIREGAIVVIAGPAERREILSV